MSRFIDALARRRWPLFVLVAVFGVLPLLVVSSDDGGSSGALAIIAVAAVGFVFLVGLNLSGRDPDSDTRARSLDPDPLNAQLLSRWLRRSKHFRFVGGLVGVIVGMGFIDGGPAPVFLLFLAGIATGGALAEVHSLRRAPSGARSADISARRLGDYVSRTDAIALIGAGFGSLALTAVALGSGRGAGDTVVVAGVGALLTVLATSLMQRLVVLRPRPALPADLRRADDLMRRLAATQGFTRPAIALAIGLLARALTSLGAGIGYDVLGLVMLVMAIIWYTYSRQSRTNLLAVART